MQTQEMREHLFTIRMNEEETARLEAVAKHYGLTSAGVIRMLLKEKERELGLLPATTTAAVSASRAAAKKGAKKR